MRARSDDKRANDTLGRTYCPRSLRHCEEGVAHNATADDETAENRRLFPLHRFVARVKEAKASIRMTRENEVLVNKGRSPLLAMTLLFIASHSRL
jgi:hypothetical protein